MELVKCVDCKNHNKVGYKHTCKYCNTKTVFGQLQEMIIPYCDKYEFDISKKIRKML